MDEQEVPLLSTAPTDFDTLADLFLDDAALGMSSTRIGPASLPTEDRPLLRMAKPTEPVHVPAVKPTTEALVLGHLPVLASTWVVPYARQRSIELGRPVGLIRIGDGNVTLDVVAANSAELPELQHTPSTLDAAILAAAPRIGAWIIRVSEVAEPETIADAGIETITVLTGADEAATVASYRTLKNLPARADGPSIRLAIMGSSAEVAKAAEVRIRHAALAYLETELPPATIIPKIAAAGLRTLHSGDFDWTMTRLLSTLKQAPAAHSPATPPISVTGVAAPMIEPKRTGRAVASSTADLLPNQASQPSLARAQAPVQAPTKAQVAEPAVSNRPSPSDSLADLTTLQTRCPYAPEVDLALDALGELHLSVLTGRGTPFMDPGMGVQRLLTAASWVADHANLLTAIHGNLRPEAAQAGPSLHLLTDEPKDVRRLLDTGVRVHLVVNAHTSAGPVQICRDLN